MVIDPKVAFINSRVLLVDIGGTNIRTASADIGSSELINASKNNLDCLGSFDDMLQEFLDKDPSIKHLVFSVAGPKLHNSIEMTNREFKIDAVNILKKFPVDSCYILNDWESIGHGLSLFKKDKMSFINLGNPFNETALILGPGTGLGAAQVIQGNIVLPTEIGNSSFAIQDLFSKLGLSKKHDFNVIEDLISGGGLARIYSEFADIDKSPEEIVATYHSDEFSQKSIDVFLKSLAQILSEFALAYMPGKGIYLAGGLMRSLNEFIDTDVFLKNFLINRKSMHADVLKQIPLALINQEMTCLHGSLNFINKISQNRN
ncbi:MAG: glucokinase [Gammaproteobacteria bacterium]|jgi:glucokinase